MKVMIAAGGTGGHIYPAVALADTLKRLKPDSEIVFFGSSNRMEAQAIPERGYPFYGLKMTSGNGGIKEKLFSAASLAKAYGKCSRILKKERPDICIGFGNYISVPLILCARRMHIPVMLHEQNSFAGKANRFLARFADAIVTCYESNNTQMPAEKIRLLGNPEATTAAETVWDPALLEEYGLDRNMPFVVFMMGSLGSTSVSKVIDDACDLFDPSYQVLIAKGKSNEYEFRHQSDDRIVITDYVDGKKMLKGCSLAVLRAGATTMAEIGAVGCASILIPSPYVPNNHQYFNAMEYVEKGGAAIIEEKDLTAEVLAAKVNELMADPDKLQQMREKTAAEGKTDAAVRMIEWMEELITHE